MYYEINVTKEVRSRSIHWFATSDRSLTDYRRAVDVFKDIKKRFPEEDGYNVTITRNEKTGYDMTVSFEQEN